MIFSIESEFLVVRFPEYLWHIHLFRTGQILLPDRQLFACHLADAPSEVTWILGRLVWVQAEGLPHFGAHINVKISFLIVLFSVLIIRPECDFTPFYLKPRCRAIRCGVGDLRDLNPLHLTLLVMCPPISVRWSDRGYKKPQDEPVYHPRESILVKHWYGISLLIMFIVKQIQIYYGVKCWSAQGFFFCFASFCFQWKQESYKEFLSSEGFFGLGFLVLRYKANACSSSSATSGTFEEIFRIFV